MDEVNLVFLEENHCPPLAEVGNFTEPLAATEGIAFLGTG